MSEQADIAIVGGGCAGLSLASRLATSIAKGESHKRVVIIEPRERYVPDRTWCMWDVAEHPFKEAITHRWNAWQIAEGERVIERDSQAHPYVHIDSGRFYELALERIEQSHVELRLGVRALSLSAADDGVVVETSDGSIHAKHVVDTRPRPIERGLYQRFVGRFIKTVEPVFNTRVATLMDFRTSDAPAPHFVYVLPFARDEALIEDTWFVPKDHVRSEAECDVEIEGYLEARYGIRAFEVLDRERGEIPMGFIREEPGMPHVTRLGLSDTARPSSGYAFLRIQARCDVLAEQLLSDTEITKERRPHWDAMDEVLIRTLERSPELAPQLFVDLAERVPTERFIRFMSSQSTALDDLLLATGVPKRRFTKEALRLAVSKISSARKRR